MTRFCPICGTHNEEAALSCKCGRVFTEDIIASQPQGPIDPKRYRRNRLIKKAGALLGALTLVLLFAAYFGGVFPMQGQADVEDNPSPAVVEARPVVKQPVASDPAAPEASVPYKTFPEINVPYRATRAITGSVIAVTDADGQERRVTLFGIRVPKLDESFGIESKERLWVLIANKPLLIKRLKFTKEVDTIAEIHIDGSNVAVEHLRSGLALLAAEEVAGLPAADQQQYLLAAQSAKSGKYGLWSGKRPGDIVELTAQSATTGQADQTAGPNYSLPSETKRPVGRTRSTGTTYDPSSYVYESVPTVVPLVSEPVRPKEQTPATNVAPKETAPSEPAAVVATPSATARKYIRGPYGGCYYINSSGNKSYVDRSKCE